MSLIHQVVLIPLVMTCHYTILDDAVTVEVVWRKKKWMLMVDSRSSIVALGKTWNCECNNWEGWMNTLLLLLLMRMMMIQKRSDGCYSEDDHIQR